MSAPARRLTGDDCLTCGACCCNPLENRRTGYRDYVEVRRTDVALRRDRALMQQWTVQNDAGEIHMRLVGEEQRCAALGGTLGARVACAIYTVRPKACHGVRPGDATCLRLRLERGIDPPADP
jgi:Fe-S-cluster containining protein